MLAEVYALALQKAGVQATTKLNIGAREVYYPQVAKGALTIIPEYNGNLLTVELDPKATEKTTADVDAALAAKLPSSLTVLNPAPGQDSDSIAVTQATAAKYKLKSIADLKSVASQLVLGGPSEFKTRHDGVVGLKSVYGLTFKSFDPLDESGPITLAALTSGKVQAADVFTTTPQIISDKLVSLSDPKSLFAAQNVIPLVYKPALTPKISSTLNAVRRQADHQRTAGTGQQDHHRQAGLHHRRPAVAAVRRPGRLTGAMPGRRLLAPRRRRAQAVQAAGHVVAGG